METVLIVDDEKNYPLILSAVLEEEGYETLTANSGAQALETLKRSDIDLILTDVKMPVMDGISLLEKVKEKDPEIPVLLMTAHGTIDKAVEAMEKGAYTYLLKPFDNDRLVLYVNKAMATYRVIQENRRLRNAVTEKYRFGNIIGKSRRMQTVFETIQKVSPTSATVLVDGESGTGKELVAKSIHYNSARSNGPFIAVNCSALAENLLESELFGHEKGAFTGATERKKGRFEIAEGGTLFLDEIGELSPNLQVKLLRVLQEKNLERVGGVKPIALDFRLIAATNKQLAEEVTKGAFRQDLFYRLNVVRLSLPPLRERDSDVQLLIDHFIEKYQKERKLAAPITGIDQQARRLLSEYPWPGNIRELENIIERAMILCPGPVIGTADLPQALRQHPGTDYQLGWIPENAKLSETLVNIEIQMIRRALQLTGNIQSHAARLLGIGKSGLNQKIKKHNISIRSNE